MSTETNKELVRKSVEALNRGDVEGYLDCTADDHIHHGVGDLKPGDKAAAEQFLRGASTALPDEQITIEDLFAEGDTVVKRYSVRGTHSGEFAGVPGTGKKVTLHGVTIYRIKNGKFAEAWWFLDIPAFLKQVGAM